MSSLKINELTNDLQITNGDLVIINGSEEVSQLLRQNIRLFKGEWFLDTTAGIPYHEEFYKKNPNVARLDAILKSAILETSGVLKLTKFDLGFINQNRSLTLSFEVLSEDGIITINEVI